MKALDSKTSCLWLLLVLSLPLHAADPRIQEELAGPQAAIPLVNTLGEEVLNDAMASGEYRYVGNTKCRLCHREFFLGRKKDVHDYAQKRLVDTGHADNPRCLVCHATGFGVETGFISFEKTPRLANVQCEGCHGPGSVHVALRDKGGFLAGTDRPDRIKKMCKSCHNNRWDRAFDDFEEAYAKYRNAVPE